VIIAQEDVKEKVVTFYKRLFGSSLHKGVHLSGDFWDSHEKLDDEDRDILGEPFSEKDVEAVIVGFRSESAPGPIGFTVILFKKL
jgi:hypothetical protein